MWHRAKVSAPIPYTVFKLARAAVAQLHPRAGASRGGRRLAALARLKGVVL